MTKKKAGETSQEEVSLIYIYIYIYIYICECKRFFDKRNLPLICPCFKSIWFPAYYWKVFKVRV